MSTPQERQAAQAAFRDTFFDGAVPLTRPAPFVPNLTRGGRAFTVPVTGGKTKNEKVGGNFTLVFEDCDGAETGRMEVERGQVITEGEVTIRSGCGGGGSSI